MIDSVSEEAPPDLKKSRRRRAAIQNGSVDRVPPHSHEAEQGVLGCILLSPKECLSCCAEKIDERAKELFYDLRHQTIFNTLLEMYDKQEAIDIITLQQRLKDKQLLEQVGGIVYLSTLPDVVPSAANIGYYFDIVLEKFVLRKMVHTCTDVVRRVYDHEGNADQLLDEVERDILAIRTGKKRTSQSARELVIEAQMTIDQLHANQGAITGLATGFEELDRKTDGLQQGDMIVIAAFPSMGKSTLAADIARFQALSGNSAAFFSFEMRARAIMLRSIYAEAEVNPYNIRDGLVSEVDFDRMRRACDRLAMAPFHIEECHGYTIQQLRAAMRRAKQEKGIKLAVVDYLQLISCPDKENRTQEVRACSKGIKEAAMELEIPVIVLSQLNDDGRLGESRAIGQDADMIWEIQPEDPKKITVVQPAKVVIRKGRNGPTGRVPLTFYKQFTKFASPEKVDGADVPEPEKETRFEF